MGESGAGAAGLTVVGVKIGEVVILKDKAEVITQGQIRIAFRKGCSRDSGSFLRHKLDGNGLE